jgi:hypothetical protein
MRCRTLLRLAAFFVGCVLVFALDGVGAGVAMYRMPNNGVFPPVQRDIVHELVPVPRACASDFLSYLLLTELAVVGVSFLLSSRGVPIIVAAGISTSLLSALRGVTTWPTSYLSPDPSCINCGRANGCPATLWEAVVTTLRFYPLKTCGDLMFSGHSMSVELFFVFCYLNFFSQVFYTSGANAASAERRLDMEKIVGLDNCSVWHVLAHYVSAALHGRRDFGLGSLAAVVVLYSLASARSCHALDQQIRACN